MKLTTKKKLRDIRYRVIGHTILCLLALLAGFVGLTVYQQFFRNSSQTADSATEAKTLSNDDKLTENSYTVQYVIDGDTFVISYEGKSTKVRLIGVDTPESVHSDSARNTAWGKKASRFTKKLLKGKKVSLVLDTEKTDRYGRLLAYVYFTKNGKKTMLNRYLVQKGMARAVCYEPNHKYKKAFEKAQKKAKKDKKGFWKDGLKAAFPNL